MKSRRSNAPILQKTAKRNIVRHPAKLSNILALTNILLFSDASFDTSSNIQNLDTTIENIV